MPYLGKYGTRLAHSFINRITPLLKIKCTFVILWKTTNSNSFLSNKDKTPMRYQSSVVYKFTCPRCNCRCIGKTDRCLYTRLKEHSQDNKSEIFNQIINCEHFQHIKCMLELTPCHDNNSTVISILPKFILNNSKIIDRSADHWSLLSFKKSLAIRQFKPKLNHGTKTLKELIICN